MGISETPELKVSIIGSGNVAWHLAHAINNSRLSLKEIIARNTVQGSRLAKEMNVSYRKLDDLNTARCDVMILAIKDAAIANTIEKIGPTSGIVVHTAGSIPMEIFSGKIRSYGVIYPFQTFTKGVNTNFRKVPLCIEASDQESVSIIRSFCQELSDFTREVNSEQRKHLHLAGIILNNFSNHLITLACEYLDKNQLEREMIKPILEETIAKLDYLTPEMAQTGPAVRGDKLVLEEHISMLKHDQQLKKLYRIISDSILAYYKS